jgi:hypothetical protein
MTILPWPSIAIDRVWIDEFGLVVPQADDFTLDLE